MVLHSPLEKLGQDPCCDGPSPRKSFKGENAALFWGLSFEERRISMLYKE
jgi:hypothetical protein